MNCNFILGAIRRFHPDSAHKNVRFPLPHICSIPMWSSLVLSSILHASQNMSKEHTRHSHSEAQTSARSVKKGADSGTHQSV